MITLTVTMISKVLLLSTGNINFLNVMGAAYVMRSLPTQLSMDYLSDMTRTDDN
jgi:hypothetical protein